MKQGEYELETAQVSEICRRKLLNYADGFYELAKSYEQEYAPGEWEDKRELLSYKRVWENRQILKDHLNEMARIMTEVACEVLLITPMEDKKKKVLVRAMREEGISVNQPSYMTDEEGHHSIVLTMHTEKQARFSAEDAADMISVLLNRRLQLSCASPLLIEREPHSFILEEEPMYVALTGFAKATREGETVSGDNYSVLEEKTGKLTVILSDGTGSGEKAGQDSDRVLDLMEKLLEAGYDINAAIGMINTALYTLGEDTNHPTMDVCNIDLYRGSCELRKAGGAATFLKKATGTEQLIEGTLPLGIFQQIETQPIHRKLEDGDYVIMMSDGVVDAFQNLAYEDALCDAISKMQEQNPGELANHILSAAVLACGGKIMDDMTVGVVGVWNSRIGGQ